MADFDTIVKQLKEKNQANKKRGTELDDQKNIVQSLDAVQNAVVRSIAVLVQTMLEDTQKVEITNHQKQLDTVNTPDAIQGAKMVEYCIKDLQRVVEDKDVDLSGIVSHLEGIHGVLERLPTEYPEMPEYPQEMAVKGLNDLSSKLDGLMGEIKKLKLDPKIDVKTPDVKIDLSKELKQIEKAIDGINIVIPEQKETDLTPLIGAMGAVQTAVREIEIPIPNFRGAEVVSELKKLRGFDIPEYDEIDLSYTGTNLTTVVYKKDSSNVATLTLTYTGDNLTKVVIS